MPLILQAANGGEPIIGIQLPPDPQPSDLFVLCASSSLSTISQLFHVFYAPFHTPSDLQIAILTEADPTLGQEWELFI